MEGGERRESSSRGREKVCFAWGELSRGFRNRLLRGIVYHKNDGMASKLGYIFCSIKE
jgi:hypothetical protein